MSFFRSLNARIRRRELPIPAGLHKFLGVGLVGLILHTGIFTLLYRIDDHGFVGRLAARFGDRAFAGGAERLYEQHSWAWLAGLCIATCVTWTLNRKLTFAASGRKLHEEIFRYAVVTAASQTVSYLVFHGLVEEVRLIPPPVDVVIGAAAATVVSYVGQRFFTFAPPSGATAEAAPK